MKEETYAAHQRLERLLALESPALALDDYFRFLKLMRAFHAAAEPLLDSDALRTLGVDMRPRAKLAWLDADLAYFGIADQPGIRVSVPRLASAAAQLGCAYVLEGATLGARVLYPGIARRWDLGAGRGASYLHGRGEETGSSWKQFVEALDAAELDEAGRKEATAAARSTFAALADALVDARYGPPPRPA